MVISAELITPHILVFIKFTVESQRSHVIIGYPGRDFELPCDVTGGTAAWFIQSLGPYSASQLFSGAWTGYNTSGNNLIIKDIVMNDHRHRYDYQCIVGSTEGDLFFLYIAGEYQCRR